MQPGRTAPPIKGYVRLPARAAPWLTLNLRVVLPDRDARGAIVLLHGATLSGFIFDVPFPGGSLQERLAAQGWATYALDLRGFGHSTRPHPGEPGLSEDRPFARAAEVVDDIADTMHYVRNERGHTRVAVMGFSWGATCAGAFAAQAPSAIDKLILFAPIHATRNPAWLQRLADPADLTRLSSAFGAYRWTSAQSLAARWDGDIPVEDKTRWRDPAVLRAVLDSALADDPLASTRSPPAFRSPNGGFADLFDSFSGRTVYDATRIAAPALLLRGEGDWTSTASDAASLLERLGSRTKSYRVIPAGGHFQCLERSMPAMLETCLEFLDGA